MAVLDETPAPAAAPPEAAHTLVFYLNGQKIVLRDFDPTTVLVDYLRSSAVGLTGTKKPCGQGGCGGCTVLLSRWNAEAAPGGQVEHLAVNSCLRPLASLDGVSITTIEGTGNTRTAVSPVQYRLAKDNGTQCGICTPGWVMNMSAFLVANAANGDRPIRQEEIDAIFDGNLCRCTGFRPILYAMRHFATDWSPADEKGSMVCLVDPGEEVPQRPQLTVDFPPELRHPARPVAYSHGPYSWYRPVTLEGVYHLLDRFHSAKVKLVVGNTSIGIYDRYQEHPHVYVDISHIALLHQREIGPDGLQLGAAVTYHELLATLDHALSAVPTDRRSGLHALRYLAHRTAGSIVRNVASLAGNTMLVVRHVEVGTPFPSDLFTALASLGAVLTVGSGAWPEPRRYPILEFARAYQEDADLRRRAMILSYSIPYTAPGEIAQTYKVALRHENAHSIANGGLRVRLSAQRIVEDAAAVFGGIAPIAFHAVGLETYLRGRAWDAATLAGAFPILRKDVEAELARWAKRLAALPYDGFSNVYRLHLVESYFYSFFVQVLEQVDPGSVPPAVRSAGERVPRPLSHGTQRIQSFPEEAPVSYPYIRLSAFAQTTGEARYTQDLPLPPRGLEAAFVVSDKANATIAWQIPGALPGSVRPAPATGSAEGAHTKEPRRDEPSQGAQAASLDDLIAYLRERFPGFVDLVTVRDIPPGGKNIQGIGGDDPLFAEGAVTCYGQSIALALATDERTAIDAAHFVSTRCIAYTPAAEEDIILSIPQAIAGGHIFRDSPSGWPTHIGAIERPGSDMSWTQLPSGTDTVIGGVPCRVVSGRQATGAQIHFYMETQACYAAPGDPGEILVWAGTQSPDDIQTGVRATLNIPANRIDVRVLLLGGAYGGKTTRSPFVASPTALAAWKHNLPVRLAMRREEDTSMIGKRHPYLGEYKVAVSTGDTAERGRLLGTDTRFWGDGGNTYDCSFIVMDCAQVRADNAYLVPNYRTSGEVCQTNVASNTAFRAFGMVQAVLIKEEGLEAAAHSLGVLPEEIRGKNLYRTGDTTPYGEVLGECYIRESWEYLIRRCHFASRVAAVREFNSKNRWKKRGISMIPVQYGSGYNLTSLEQGGALVEVYAQDGTVLVRHGGVEMGQGIMTNVSQLAAYTLNVPLASIQIGPTDTRVVTNPVSTGASTGTALNGGAVRAACQLLRRRLEAFCTGLLVKNGADWCKSQGIDFWDYPNGWQAIPEGTKGTTVWQNIVSLANNDRVDLTAQVRYREKGGTESDTGLIFPSPQEAEAVDQFVDYTYSAACSEVEIDVLTGETTILSSYLAYDAGKSLNPAIDVGQIEGAFVQGIGMMLTEEVIFQPDGDRKGTLYTTNTWTYKVPAMSAIPLELHVDLLPRDEESKMPPNPRLLLSSKESGEPPLVLATTVFFAVKHAILAAREDRGHKEWFSLECPATVQRIREACRVEAVDLTV